MNLRDAIERLRQNRARLERLGVKHAYVFGSVANDAATQASDVDVMIDLDEGPGGRKPLFSAFDVGGIQYALSEIFERPVDLVVRSDALEPGRRLKTVAETSLVDAF